MTPRALVEDLERYSALPAGAEERFSGYGVMGLPFTSGHILAMRRFPASSIGPGYTSVWHRDPDERWVFYADVPPRFACARFFGAIAADSVETEIKLAWTGPYRLRVLMPAESLDWDVVLQATPATRLMNAAGRLLPNRAWRSRPVLALMAAIAGQILGVGRVGLHGTAPNRQRFIANPRVLWAVTQSRASVRGNDFGPPGPVRPQARLGDFWIPQRGILAVGQAFFDPFDVARHSADCRLE